MKLYVLVFILLIIMDAVLYTKLPYEIRKNYNFPHFPGSGFYLLIIWLFNR